MPKYLSDIIDNPVRLYGVVAAAVALVAFYVTLPVPLILALVAALLGVGEGVRSRVAPMSRVVIHRDDLIVLDEDVFLDEDV